MGWGGGDPTIWNSSNWIVLYIYRFPQFNYFSRNFTYNASVLNWRFDYQFVFSYFYVQKKWRSRSIWSTANKEIPRFYEREKSIKEKEHGFLSAMVSVIKCKIQNTFSSIPSKLKLHKCFQILKNIIFLQEQRRRRGATYTGQQATT